MRRNISITDNTVDTILKNSENASKLIQDAILFYAQHNNPSTLSITELTQQVNDLTIKYNRLCAHMLHLIELVQEKEK